MINSTLRLCNFCVKLHSGIVTRMLSTTPLVWKGYEQWPYKKFRRVGRAPTVWRGQGGKKSRLPYDKRYPLSGKDINTTTEGLKRGGNEEMGSMIGEARTQSNPAVLKYFDYVKNREIVEVNPEMIPEFVVPDLTDFKLKPYVSYRVGTEVQTEPKHTPDQLYKDTYQVEILKNTKS